MILYIAGNLACYKLPRFEVDHKKFVAEQGSNNHRLLSFYYYPELDNLIHIIVNKDDHVWIGEGEPEESNPTVWETMHDPAIRLDHVPKRWFPRKYKKNENVFRSRRIRTP